METERPHLSTNSNNTSTSELFICFTSRLSSSSMKLSSKSILSPGRARESSQVSLSSSLSRRLKTSGSLKGGASPMFPTTGKKRGCAFENPEPSSPKVTCIGQVRVKTKKQGKKMRSRSKRREASFRKGEQAMTSAAMAAGSEECLPHRTQKWVHLPLTICEALRGFGAEFNCFLPCRSSCTTSEKEKEEKDVRSEDGRSCGAIFARWLVASREIELVVGEEERTERSGSQRREVFEGIEFKEEKKEIEVEEEEEEGRVGVCVPPKNALLLMRCRSDPVKMAALANRFWEAPVPNEEEEEEEEENEDSYKCKEAEQVKERLEVELENAGASMENEILGNGICSNDDLENPEVEEEVWDNGICSNDEDRQNPEEEEKEVEEEANLVGEEEERDDDVAEDAEANAESTEIDTEEGEAKEENDGNVEEEDVIVNQSIELAEETEFRDSIAETPDPEKVEEEENLLQILLENQNGSEEERELEKEEPENEEESFPISSMASTNSEQEPDEPNQEDEEEEERSEPEYPNTRGRGPNLQKENPVLPDCLLLMMCEPKLSMEVSKETWVCSTDFVRWLPERPVKKSSDEAKKPPASTKKESNRTHPAQQAVQPHRSSCSFPVQAVRQSMATMVEQKLVGSNRYEPFVLTRCKSEPMRSAAAKFAPEGSCLWKNRKLEPHRQATLGVGAAGVGF